MEKRCFGCRGTGKNMKSRDKLQFQTITAAEFLASKFLSFIGKNTGHYELETKFRKKELSVEAITETIHGYMYGKLHCSTKTEEEKTIRHVEKRNNKDTNAKRIEVGKLEEWTGTDAEDPTGPISMIVQQED